MSRRRRSRRWCLQNRQAEWNLFRLERWRAENARNKNLFRLGAVQPRPHHPRVSTDLHVPGIRQARVARTLLSAKILGEKSLSPSSALPDEQQRQSPHDPYHWQPPPDRCLYHASDASARLSSPTRADTAVHGPSLKRD